MHHFNDSEMPISTLIATAGAAAIQHIVTQKVMPALASLAESVKKDFKLNVEPIGTHFEEYLRRTYETQSILNTLVFRNQQKQLRDLYIPLTLVQEGVKENSHRNRIKIEGYPNDLITKYRRVLINDSAGMGKSTMTKIMFLSAIDKEAGIPFYVELRKLTEKHLILDEIKEQLGSLTEEFDNSLMCSFFQSGGFIFFFDGFDEISLTERESVTKDIKRFIEKAPDNYYIMTSRDEQALAGFGDFQSMKICPLTKSEAYSLLRKYDSNGETSKHLIEKLDAGDYNKIKTFMKTPLLVSMLFIGFDYKPEIPLQITTFYNQVFEAYFNAHDLSKDASFIRKKESGLDMYSFEKVLRAIGYICLNKHLLEFSRTNFLEILDKAGKLSCVSLNSPESLMDDLLHAVPLFCQDGVNYKWVHKSMQEYFAADFINRDCAEKKESILRSLVNSPNINNYLNLIVLYADLDSKGFQQLFVLPVLDDYIRYMERPIDYSGEQEMIEKIMFRRQIIYCRDMYFCILPSKNKETSLPELADLMREKMGNQLKHGIISHLRLKGYSGLFYAPGKYHELSLVIANKYPQVKWHRVGLKEIDLKHIEYDKPYHITESLLIENPDAYDELNLCVSELMPLCFDYEQAKILKDSITRTLNENEDVFKDLMEL